MSTFRVVVTNPATGKQTVRSTGLTREEAGALRLRLERAEQPRNGVTLIFTVEAEGETL